jgi:glycine cleavage system H protein
VLDEACAVPEAEPQQGAPLTGIKPDRRYSAEHEWVVLGDGATASFGISHIAADALGDIVYVDLPEVGSALTAGAVCGEIESTKTVSDLYSPVSGMVVATNDAVIAEPALLNEDPYDSGWLVRVEMSAEGTLLTADQYAALVGEAL